MKGGLFWAGDRVLCAHSVVVIEPAWGGSGCMVMVGKHLIHFKDYSVEEMADMVAAARYCDELVVLDPG